MRSRRRYRAQRRVPPLPCLLVRQRRRRGLSCLRVRPRAAIKGGGEQRLQQIHAARGGVRGADGGGCRACAVVLQQIRAVIGEEGARGADDGQGRVEWWGQRGPWPVRERGSQGPWPGRVRGLDTAMMAGGPPEAGRGQRGWGWGRTRVH